MQATINQRLARIDQGGLLRLPCLMSSPTYSFVGADGDLADPLQSEELLHVQVVMAAAVFASALKVLIRRYSGVVS